MTMTDLRAILGILGQALVVYGILRFVKSFGAFTEAHRGFTAALLYTQETNLMVHREQMKILAKLDAIPPRQKEVA